MRSKVEYSWEDVKDAVNRYLSVAGCSKRDWVKDIYSNGLPSAMDSVAVFHLRGTVSYHEYSVDIELIKKAYKQLNKVGYIGRTKND